MAWTTSPLPMIKISATGNDFLLIDLIRHTSLWQVTGALKSRSECVKQWCDRHEGIGADGVVFIEPSNQVDFVWDFYNSDGSVAEMCGNAARATSLYYFSLAKKKEIQFATKIGVVKAWIHSESDVEVELPAVGDVEWEQPSQMSEPVGTFSFVQAGVPHAVLFVKDVREKTALQEMALKIKKLPRFQKDGVNVTFVQKESAKQIHIVTFERGVENFTLSCGTGAVAAAYSVLKGQEDFVLEVGVPGGSLSVCWRDGKPRLRGPAKIVAETHWVQCNRGISVTES